MLFRSAVGSGDRDAQREIPCRCGLDGEGQRGRAGLPQLPERALAQDLEHQPAGAAQQEEQEMHERGRHLPQRRRLWPPADYVDTRLVGSQLLEQQEEWQLERRRFFSEATMAKIPEPEEAFVLTHGDPADQAATTAS